MFNSKTLADVDLDLDTTFAPIISSTQEKRRNETPTEELPKKIRLENDGSFYSPNKIVKRIFPGPAGLLGDHTEMTDKNSIRVKDDFLLCSQRTLCTFTEGPWKLMSDDFYTTRKVEQLYDKYTVSWIKKNYSHKKVLNNYKAPFLACIIQSIDKIHGKIPSVHITLKDTTGTINATILYSFYQEKSEYLTTGSVIVLQQFGVLTSPEGHCLTLTANNLLIIYHVKDPSCKENESVQKIVIKESTPEDIWNEVDSIIVKNKINKPNFSNIYNNSNSITKNNFLLPKIKSINTSPNVVIQNDVKKKYEFKNIDDNSITIKNNSTQNETDIWKTMLEDVDTDSLFGDF